jgi:hypothetical protein
MIHSSPTFLYISMDISPSIALYRSLHEIMVNPDCECTDNPNAAHYSVTLPGTRVTESDSGEPEDELSELVRPGYNTIQFDPFQTFIYEQFDFIKILLTYINLTYLLTSVSLINHSISSCFL